MQLLTINFATPKIDISVSVITLRSFCWFDQVIVIGILRAFNSAFSGSTKMDYFEVDEAIRKIRNSDRRHQSDYEDDRRRNTRNARLHSLINIFQRVPTGMIIMV